MSSSSAAAAVADTSVADTSRLGVRAAAAATQTGLSVASTIARAGWTAGRAAQAWTGLGGPLVAVGLDLAECLHLLALDSGAAVAGAVGRWADATIVSADAVARQLGSLRGVTDGPEAARARDGFRAILDRFLAGVPDGVTRTQLLQAVVAYAALQRREKAATDSVAAPTDQALLQRLARWSEVAVASYGRLAVSFLSGDVYGFFAAGGPEGGEGGAPDGLTAHQNAAADRAFFLRKAGIDHDADLLVFAAGGPGAHRPGHQVFVDHASHSVVVSVRGTMSLPDLLTDGSCRAVPYEREMGARPNLMVHEGFLQSARLLDTELRPLVREALRQLRSRRADGTDLWGVTLTGHSLGAGVTSLLTLLWMDEFGGGGGHSAFLRCWAFGPPCVGNPSLCELLRPYVTSCVNNDDLVGRLSIGSCDDLRDRVLDILTAGDAASTTAHGDARGALSRLKELRQKHSGGAKLYPPGQILRLGAWLEEGGVVELKQWQDFDELVVSWSCVTDHLPLAYEAAVRRAAKVEETLRPSQVPGPRL